MSGPSLCDKAAEEVTSDAAVKDKWSFKNMTPFHMPWDSYIAYKR